MKKIITIILIILEVFIIIYSKEVISEFKNTLRICLYSLLPTMFFSILLSNLIIENGLYLPKIIYKLINRIFNLNKEEINVLFLSMISGYPNNITMLKESNNENINYITNFVNPLFLIGTVGTIYLNNKPFSFLILICHYISNFILMFLLKSKNTKNNYKTIKNNNNIYSNSIQITIKALSIIISNLLFISLLVTLLKLVLPFSKETNSIILGLLEFSKGIYEVSNTNFSLFIKGLIILIIITFGSISIHFQMISINPKIKYINFLKYRIINVLISIIVYFIINGLILIKN